MAAAFVQKATVVTATSVTSFTTNSLASVTSGNRVLVAVVCNFGNVADVTSIKDSANNNWSTTPDVSIVSTGTNAPTIQIFGFKLPASYSNYTATITCGSNSYTANLYEYSGIDGTTPVSATHTGSGSSTAYSSGAATCPAGGIAFGCACDDSGTGPTLTLNWSGSTSRDVNEALVDFVTADKADSSSTSETAAWTSSTSNNWAAAIVTYNAAAGGAAVTHFLTMLGVGG